MQSTPRPGTLPGVYRFVAAVLLVLWVLPLVAFLRFTNSELLAQEVSNSSTAIALARVDTNATPTEEEHRKVCSCANCPGGTHCCCMAAESPQGGLAIRAFCDDTPPTPIAGVSVVKIAFLGTIQSVPTPDSLPIADLYHPGDDSAVSHSRPPFLLPPRLS